MTGRSILTALALVAGAGCGNKTPTITPEMEAQQKAADKEVNDGEKAWQKEQRKK
ncbi:hypothetical protein J0H58_14310 [bacterium]|nr:hypothetical protein [bacterium]